jgi:hypothetical protein
MPLQHVNTLVTTTPKLLVKIPTTVKDVAIQIYNNTGAAITLVTRLFQQLVQLSVTL